MNPFALRLDFHELSLPPVVTNGLITSVISVTSPAPVTDGLIIGVIFTALMFKIMNKIYNHIPLRFP